MKEARIKRKSCKSIVLFLSIAFFLLAAICPLIVFSFKHKPFLMQQTEVTFVDSNQNVYFSLIGRHGLKKYKNDSRNYQNYIYDNSEITFNCEQVVANSKNIFVALEHFSRETFGIIKFFDTAFNELKTLEFGSFLTVRGLACTEKSLYYVLKNTNNDSCSLFKLDLETNIQTELVTGLLNTDFYQDEEVSMFFSDLFRIQKITTKTILIKKVNQKNKQSYFTDGKVKLAMSGNKIFIENEGASYFFDTSKSFNYFYDKVVLVDNHLLFGVYKKTNNPKCGATDQSQCICGMKESYLFDFNVASNELKIIQEFKEGTFLIDYDLGGVKYYYNGSLYNGSTLCKKCVNVYDYKSKETFVGILGHWHDPVVNYYLSYYNGEFYGI